MTKIFLAVAMASQLMLHAANAHTTAATGKTDKFKVIHVTDLEKNMKNQTITIFDVNTKDTRHQVGVIPGARLLSGAEDYSLTLLPKSKSAKLVFYCANTMCMASHHAADRAIKNGYKDVSVMVDGIYGWRDAGQKLETLN